MLKHEKDNYRFVDYTAKFQKKETNIWYSIAGITIYILIALFG